VAQVAPESLEGIKGIFCSLVVQSFLVRPG